MTFEEKLQSLGFTLCEGGSYENYINDNSVEITLRENGNIVLVVYNEETEEEILREYRSSAPVMRIINKLINK